MRVTASILALVSIFCCLLATGAAKAQEFLQRSGDFSAGPSGPGKSVKGDVTDLLSGPVSGPAIGSTLPAIGRSLNPSDQFTLGGTQSSVTLDITRSSPIFAGEKPAADKSCLAARAYIRPDIVNKNLHQNWISAKNSCGHYMKIRVCYLGTENCIPIDVPPWQTKNAIIGYAPTAKPIHYQISLEN
jgi:hypothetical protein